MFRMKFSIIMMAMITTAWSMMNYLYCGESYVPLVLNIAGTIALGYFAWSSLNLAVKLNENHNSRI